MPSCAAVVKWLDVPRPTLGPVDVDDLATELSSPQVVGRAPECFTHVRDLLDVELGDVSVDDGLREMPGRCRDR